MTRRVLTPVNQLPILRAVIVPNRLSTQAARQLTVTTMVILMYTSIVIPIKFIAVETFVVPTASITVLLLFLDRSEFQAPSTTSLPSWEVPFICHVARRLTLTDVSGVLFTKGTGLKKATWSLVCNGFLFPTLYFRE
jgi:uncharacterized membrane protein AbrB (regulator of aidB expression)